MKKKKIKTYVFSSSPSLTNLKDMDFRMAEANSPEAACTEIHNLSQKDLIKGMYVYEVVLKPILQVSVPKEPNFVFETFDEVK